jgi:hypothetical protein
MIAQIQFATSDTGVCNISSSQWVMTASIAPARAAASTAVGIGVMELAEQSAAFDEGAAMPRARREWTAADP